MANKRCLHTLTRLCKSSSSTLYYSNSSSSSSLQSLKTLKPHHLHSLISPRIPLNPKFDHIFTNLKLNSCSNIPISRHFSSNQGRDGSDDDESEDEGDESEGEYGDEDVLEANCGVGREYSLEERESEAAAIGYKVIGTLERDDRVFKPYEPVFAVVQIGSHQFKVSNGDCIYTERLKFCDVHDKLILNKVLMLGSRTQTMIGRPVLPDAAVHAIVEEHALDAKVIIFKKKRRKNYRRTKGHRQELTKLRITDIQGIEKPEMPPPEKPEKSAAKKVEKVAVAA